jgi:uncharacterized protein YndB with AHSA1/START domain
MSHSLSITRMISAPRAVVWRCWSEPALLKQWYCPRPWRVTEAEIDLRPGGRANTVFEGPNGERHDNKGVYLEVVTMERLIFTDTFSEGFIPKDGAPFMTGYVHLSDATDGGTEMVWGARHWTAEAREQHEKMGFHEGWSAAAAQLDDLAQQVATGKAKAA